MFLEQIKKNVNIFSNVKTAILNDDISQYYYFYCIFDNADLVSILRLFKNIKKVTDPKLLKKSVCLFVCLIYLFGF